MHASIPARHAQTGHFRRKQVGTNEFGDLAYPLKVAYDALLPVLEADSSQQDTFKVFVGLGRGGPVAAALC